MNYTQGVHIDIKLVQFRTCVVQIQFQKEIGGKSEVILSVSHNICLPTHVPHAQTLFPAPHCHFCVNVHSLQGLLPTPPPTPFGEGLGR